MSFKRAITKNNKKLRIESIVLAAERIIASKKFEECNLNYIANDVGMSKAAIYRYFRVKEIIFLDLYLKELRLLQPSLQLALSSKSAEEITRALISRPIFCKLSSILTTVLEQPLTLNEAIKFKVDIAIILQPIFIDMSKNLLISPEDGLNWLMHLFASLVGCWHLSNPSDLMLKAYETPALAVFNLNFEDTLQAHIEMMLPSLNQ
jgi:AcrR family transcriptional regulator